MALLEVNKLSTGYGEIQVLYSVNVSVREKEIVAIFGSNGSGKSTLLKTIAGILPLWEGYIKFEGESIDNLPPQERVKKGIALAMEGRRLFLGMTVEENLLMGAWVSKDLARERIEKVYSYFPALKEKRKSLAGDLSGGQQQMLSIGRALMSNPKLLMVDELSLGLAPAVVETLAEVLEELRSKEGISILLVEQEVRLALEVADRAYVFDLGRVVDEGPSEELLKRDSIRKAYLSI